MPTAGDGKRPSAKPRAGRGEKRLHYVDCARHLFADFGYASVSIDQVAEKAGISRATLVRMFPDKTDLLRAIGIRWLDTLFPKEEAVEHTPIDVVNRLLGFTERFSASRRDDPATARIIVSGLAEEVEDEEAVILGEILEDAIDRLQPIIIEGQQSGVIRRDIDSRQSSADFLRFFLGSALLPFAELKEGDIPTLAIETLLHGLLKTDV